MNKPSISVRRSPQAPRQQCCSQAVLEQLVLRTRVEFWVRDSLLDFIQLLLAFAVGRANSSLRRHCEKGS